MNITELKTSVLMKHKEVWIDKLRYNRVKLVKIDRKRQNDYG